MSEIATASNLLTDRKLAAAGPAHLIADGAVMQRAMVGLDINYGEASRTGHAQAHALAAGVVAERVALVDACGLLTGMWIDGLATGVLLQQRRRIVIPPLLPDTARHVGYLATLHATAHGGCGPCAEILAWAATAASADQSQEVPSHGC